VSNEGNFVLASFLDTQIVGTAGFFRNVAAKMAHKGRVWGVYVVPAFRHRGIARDMMKELLARVRTMDGFTRCL